MCLGFAERQIRETCDANVRMYANDSNADFLIRRMDDVVWFLNDV
jgi:hypothetical protein